MTLFGRIFGVGALAIAIIMSTVVAPVHVPSAEAVSTSRLSGSDRYATAAAVSAQFDPGVPVAYVASGVGYADALSAAPAAAVRGGPLLLTAPTVAPASLVAELRRLKPLQIVVVGGLSAVSASVYRTLAELAPSIRRDAGRDRYATSRVVIERAFPAGSASGAYLATGRGFADALSAAASAGANDQPVLLVDGTASTIDSATAAVLQRLGVRTVTIAGATSAISAAVERAVKAVPSVDTVVRRGGADRYATAVSINTAGFAQATNAYLAIGTGYADALAGAALAGSTGAPLHLVRANCVPAAVLEHLDKAGVTHATLLGGANVLGSAVSRLASCEGGPSTVAPPTEARPTGPLYVDTTSRAAYEAARLQSEGKMSEAADIRVIAEQPQAVWINGNETGAALSATLGAHRVRADAAGQRLVVVTYAIPFRDCGSYSAGGLTAEQYPGWNKTVADTLRGSGAIVIVEPDGLTGVLSPECSSIAQSRPSMIKSAVETLAAAGLNVYIDAGHSNWANDATMADLLRQAGIASARGFATNVSNYRPTENEIEWAQRVSDKLGGKRFVVDVSRNGNGPSNEWCNPSGRALGVNPTLTVNNGALDGLLWVKRPGESDGTCNGGPAAGHWWHDYAIGLVRSR